MFLCYDLYTNYLLYGGLETVGLGLTFLGGCVLACSNACISKLLFTIITFLKVNNKCIRGFIRHGVFSVKGISARSRWKYLGIPLASFIKTFRYKSSPATWIPT